MVLEDNFLALVGGLISHRLTVLGSTGLEAGYPVAHLKDFRLTRRIKANADTVEITIDASALPTHEKTEVRYLDIVEHNLSNADTITVQSSQVSDFSVLEHDVSDFVIPIDADTEPLHWQETNISRKVYKKLHFNLGADISDNGANDYYRLIFERADVTPALDPLEIGQVELSWGFQWIINYIKGWLYKYSDQSIFNMSSAGIPFIDQKDVLDNITIGFDLDELQDTLYADYFVRKFGIWRPLFLALEPSKDNLIYSKDGIRQHRLTFYGLAQITELERVGIKHHDYELKLISEPGGAGKPPYPIIAPPIVEEVTLVSVNLTPDSVELLSTETQLFSTIGHYSDGSTGVVTGSFSASGGTLNFATGSSTTYTAGAISGTYSITFIEDTLGLTDTSTIIIGTPPAPPCMTEDINLLQNPSFEILGGNGVTPANWTNESESTGRWQRRSQFNGSYGINPYAPQQGTYFMGVVGNDHSNWQDLDVTSCATEIDLGGKDVSYSVYTRTDGYATSGGDLTRIRVEFYNASNGLISTGYDSGYINGLSSWTQYMGTLTMPSGTRKVRLKFTGKRGPTHPAGNVGIYVFFDTVSLFIPS